MNDIELWLAANDQYLATALGWLRERLERLAGGEKPAALTDKVKEVAQAVEPEPPKQRSLIDRLLKSEPQPAEPTKGLPPKRDEPRRPTATASEKPALPAAMIEAEAASEPPALVLLCQRLGLSEFERHTLLLCAAMELDTRIAGLCARAQGETGRPYPTFALALTLFDQPAWDVMSPERPLRYWRLIEINQPGAQPLVTSALKADEHIVNYLKGLNYLDDRLSPLLMALAPDKGALPPSQARVADMLVSQLHRASDGAPLPVFQLLGTDSEAKRMIASEAASRLGLKLYRLHGDAMPQQTGDLETFVRLWQRESMLLPIALYIDAAHLDRANSLHATTMQRMLSRSMGVTFIDTREPWPELDRGSVMVDVAKPTPSEQHTAWREALRDSAENHPARLAGQFNFNCPTIRTIAVTALASHDDQSVLGDRLWAGCLGHTRPTLNQLAQALETKATWQDLELPASEKKLLQQICEQVKNRVAVYDDWGFRERMNRGLGISVLFAGESGTGKTMAAEVIANDLGLLLYRIDLSGVVSKYIGETEKNLRKLFDAAEDGGAILFFDEADALFGKRSEVKDSHDRYANIEINYLLQRIESYRGLAILATNMKASLDSAFLRRLRFIVNFPFPGPAERMAIWENVFPANTPKANLEHTRLAKLNLTGGSIHNIALNAAFLAAQAGTPVSMPLILDAARNEFRKLEKPINEVDFRYLESAGGNA
jgi:ATPase family associated with various cellular activities (AAA)